MEFNKIQPITVDGIMNKGELSNYILNDEVQQHNIDTADSIRDYLGEFGIDVGNILFKTGARFTRYELSLMPGTTYNKVKSRLNDLCVKYGNVRLTPPEEGCIIEIENEKSFPVSIKDCIGWDPDKSLQFALGNGKDGSVVCDIEEMPHLLIAGSTNSGKSVCINSIIASIIARTSGNVGLILIDPKQVEFAAYEGLPHLMVPVITDPYEAVGQLAWACEEMDGRYEKLSELGYKSNKDCLKGMGQCFQEILIVIDELADLMMTCGKKCESHIVRLAQKGRAAGIHLVVATQEPTVNVITGLIKANMPSRIAFKTATSKESVVILGHGGAEKLLGKGDMLFQAANSSTCERLQGVYVSDEEIHRIVDFIKKQINNVA